MSLCHIHGAIHVTSSPLPAIFKLIKMESTFWHYQLPSETLYSRHARLEFDIYGSMRFASYKNPKSMMEISILNPKIWKLCSV